MHDDPIMKFLQSTNKLAAFCSQNGGIIDESIHYEVLERHADSLMIYVTFLESIMEGSGCQCDQKSCYGQLRLELNDNDEIISADIV